MERVKRFKFIILALIAYTVIALLRPDLFQSAFDYTKSFLWEMVQVLPPVLVITAMITVWVPSEVIKKGLGTASGVKGKVLSFLIGSLSAGPIYAAFPASYMLFKKGSSISNVVIILSSWAVIKVPMLFVEMKFIGFRFMIIRLSLTIPAILVLGFLCEKLIPRDTLKSSEEPVFDLPNMNCGGCGFSSCQEFAQALINQEKRIEDCVFKKKLRGKNLI